MAQGVKNPPAKQEIQEIKVRSLGQKVSLEERTAAHTSILAWKIQWIKAPGRPEPKGSQRSGHSRAHTRKSPTSTGPEPAFSFSFMDTAKYSVLHTGDASYLLSSAIEEEERV